MACSSMLTLRDDSQMRPQDLALITIVLKGLAKHDYVTFFDLVRKCRDESAGYSADLSKRELVDSWSLIDENGRVADIVKRVVKNSVRGESIFMKFVDPRLKA